MQKIWKWNATANRTTKRLFENEAYFRAFWYAPKMTPKLFQASSWRYFQLPFTSEDHFITCIQSAAQNIM